MATREHFRERGEWVRGLEDWGEGGWFTICFHKFYLIELAQKPSVGVNIVPILQMRKLRLRVQVTYPFSHRRKKQNFLPYTKLLHAHNPQPQPGSTPPTPHPVWGLRRAISEHIRALHPELSRLTAERKRE